MNPGPNERESEAMMKHAISGAIADGDTDFAQKVAEHQTVVDPVQLVGWMHDQLLKSDFPGDPLARVFGEREPQDPWDKCLGRYVMSLGNEDLPTGYEWAAVHTVLNDVTQNRGKRTAPEWEYDYYWPHELSDEALDRITESDFGRTMVVLSTQAGKTLRSAHLDEAGDLLSCFASEQDHEFRLVLDTRVHFCAEELARKAVAEVDSNYLQDAYDIIAEYASHDESARMESSLDKYAFWLVEAALEQPGEASVDDTVEVLGECISDNDRKVAMLKKLGL